jgi:signal transduction histidine kinase
MLRGIQLALAGTVLGVAILAVASLANDPEAGVTAISPGGTVLDVVPGSPLWRDGVRVGDRVLEIRPSNQPGGWRFVTFDGVDTLESKASNYVATQQSYLGWIVAGFLVAVIVAVTAYRGVSLAAITLPISFAFVAEPLIFAGNQLASLVGGVAIFAGGGLAAGAFPNPGDHAGSTLRRRDWIRWVAAACGVALAAAWALSLVAAPALFDPLDGLRWPAAVVFAMVGAWLVIDRDQVRTFLQGDRHGDRAPAFIDLAYASIALGLLLAAGLVIGVAPPFILAAGIIALVVYPYWRRAALVAFDRLVTSTARRDAAIRAVESERGRLAREIHDVPLQELAGVIRQLDTVPAAAGAASTLRDVSARLREVATTLQPPVLEDLGLVAAITDMVDMARSHHRGPTIEAELDDLTQDGRPAEDVEIAAFRIIQEALSNAAAHSGAARISVSGVVAPDSVVLEVTDDGRGYTREDVRTARHAGHFGLDSMRDRALAVGATLDQWSGSDGVRVTFNWARNR